MIFFNYVCVILIAKSLNMRNIITHKGNGVASIKNDFILKACYDLSTNESKLVWYLISTIDSKNIKDFDLRTMKVKDLEKLFTGNKKKWGSFYKRINGMCKSIMSKPIRLPKGFMVEGEAIEMDEYIHWFRKISPKYDADRDVSIEFHFHDDVKPYLLSIQNRFVQIDVKSEFFPLTGKHTLRIYPAFKAARKADIARYPNSKKTALVYGIEELKGQLAIQGKYSSIKNFRVRVVEPIVNEINEKSAIINVGYSFLKSGRTITAIEFSVTDVVVLDGEHTGKRELPDYVPSEKEIETLTWGRRLAYTELVKFGVKEGIVFKRILPTIIGSEIEGFEDLFVKYSLEHFKRWSKNQQNKAMGAGTFVKWWLDKKVFDNNSKGNAWGKIMEQVIVEKKKMNQVAFDNRVMAKKMTEKEFKDWYRKNEQQKEKVVLED